MQAISPDVYAIPSLEGETAVRSFNNDINDRIFTENQFVYFIAIIDPLTNYGFKKQAAKAAKTVKYGSNVDGKLKALKSPDAPHSRSLIF